MWREKLHVYKTKHYQLFQTKKQIVKKKINKRKKKNTMTGF